jgi:hypothetical protein
MHILLLLASLLISSPCFGKEASYGVPAKAVKFVVLDKTSAKSTTFNLPVGECIRLKGLTIRVVRAWRVIDPSRPESLASFEVFEGGQICRSNLIFAGWISSTYPGCSCLEHPRYAIAVLESAI